MEMIKLMLMIADASHEIYVDTILETITAAAKVRVQALSNELMNMGAEMKEGKAIIALHRDEFAGFCYIESGEQTIRSQLRADCG